jgi:hypothetical protein
MSHLPHVLDYKAKLVELGITCPEQCAKFALEAYATAIIRSHFKSSCSIGLSENEEERVWAQLDRWNKISPINGSFVHATVKDRMNRLRASLILQGKLPEPFTVVVVVEGTEGVDITQCEQFRVLVDYLMSELDNGHE